MKKRVLFVCLGNSCRSIMPEALTGNYFMGVLEAASAGIHPLGYITEETKKVLEEKGTLITS